MKHLRYDYIDAVMGHRAEAHPQVVMQALGITYKVALPQAMVDQWIFFGCDNVPETLPPYITEMTDSIEKYRGKALSDDQVNELTP